mmetsp:Transcript_9136/g.11886  ORF Transcript_9136/g.11886 Transcript_9136/m.11886 type:complete len:282 (+) Transcript_9136:99-944(+)
MYSSVKALCLLTFLLAHFSSCFASSEAEDYIYCEPRNCYDVLGVDQSASTQEIRKKYRSLSKKWHPDINKSPDAAEKFRIIALANEVLSDKEERAEYDYYLAHPEQAFYNKMRFYRRRYAPKSDARIVVLVFVVVVSAIQYAVRVRQHSVAIKYFKTYDKKFKIRVKQLAAERFEEQQVQAKAKNGAKARKKVKKDNKEQLAKLEKEITEELANEIEIEGGYKKPELRDLFAFRIIVFPYTVGKSFVWNADWIYRHSIKKEPYSYDEKVGIKLAAVNLCFE